MTIDEHANAVVAKCHELLAIAEKRTPGKWIKRPSRSWPIIVPDNDRMLPVAKVDCSVSDNNRPYEEAVNNAAFIASAAGPFEASLRSTIAAIEGVRRVRDSLKVGEDKISRWDACNMELHAIIACWPVELLK